MTGQIKQPLIQVMLHPNIAESLPSKRMIVALIVCAFSAGAGFGMVLPYKPVSNYKPQEVKRISRGVIAEAVADEVDLIEALAQAHDGSAKNSFEPVLDKTLHYSHLHGLLLTQQIEQHKSNKKEQLIVARAETSAKISMIDTDSTAIINKVEKTLTVKPEMTLTNPTVPTTIVAKKLNTTQQSAQAYQSAIHYLQQGRIAESLDMLKQTLAGNPLHDDARQTLVGLLVENQKNSEAIEVLKAGLQLSPTQVIYAETLARLQLDAGMLEQALNTLQHHLVYGQHASYQALIANVYQRLGQHQQAVDCFKNALATGVNEPAYWIGLALSHQALGEDGAAMDAFQHVQKRALSPALAVFVAERMKQIQ